MTTVFHFCCLVLDSCFARYIAIQDMLRMDGGASSTGDGARATKALKQSVAPPPLDERLAWLASRHPVIRRLMLWCVFVTGRGIKSAFSVIGAFQPVHIVSTTRALIA